MLSRARPRPLFALRAFILAPPVCITNTTALEYAPSSSTLPPCRSVAASRRGPSHCPASRRFIATSPSSATSKKTVPYAVTAAVRAFKEQVQREELDFLPHAYEHLRRVVLDAERWGFPLLPNSGSESILPHDTVKQVRSLLAASPKREHAALHLAMFDDLRSVFHVRAEMVHPLEFTARVFHEHLRTDALGTLTHIYDHLRHLAEATPDANKVFATEEATAWRALSWMRHLSAKRASSRVLPSIFHDLTRLFSCQPTLEHHQLVIRGFLSSDMPDQAWAWLAKMEREEEGGEDPVWLKPRTEHYDLILKYFAKRGDVMSVRIGLAQMLAHAAPSQLSYHLLLFAILTTSMTASNQRMLLESVMEEMQNKGYGIHLKTLGGVAQRGRLDSWVDKDVLDLLKDAQTRSKSKSKSLRHHLRERREGELDAPPKTDAIEDSASVRVTSQESRQAASVSQTKNIETREPHQIPSGTAAVHSERKYDPLHPVYPKKADANPIGSPLPSEPVTDLGNNSSGAHIDTPTNAVQFSHSAVGSPNPSRGFKEMLNVVRQRNVAPSADVAAVDLSNMKSASVSERLARRKAVPSLQHGQKKAAESSPYQPVSQQQTNRFGGEQEVTNASVAATDVASELTNPYIPADPPSSDCLSTPKVVEASDEPQVRKLPVSHDVQTPSSPAVNKSKFSRSKHRWLFYKTLRDGDLRDAAKIYAQAVAAAGRPDLELSAAMIKALCRGHLLQPPPRPHIMQALQIYRSIAEMERDADVKGFFDGANRQHAKIGIEIYEPLLRALSSPAPASSSSRDHGPEVYAEYATYATELVADMESRGLHADNRTLISVLLLRFRASKTHREAFDHYKSFVEDNPKSTADNDQVSGPRGALSIAECRTILNAFVKLSLPDAPVAPADLWLSIVDDMRTREYHATVADYTRYMMTLLDSQPGTLLAAGDANHLQSLYASAAHIHGRMALDANISPDAYLLNTLMNVYQHLGAFEDALQVFNMIWLSGRMDDVTPVIIFDACGHAGRQDVAHMIWCMLVAKGWSFDKRTLDTWVECLCRTDIESACKFVCVYMGRENSGYLSKGDTRPDVQTCLILLKLSWLQGRNDEVKDRIRAHLPHIWDQIALRYK